MSCRRRSRHTFRVTAEMFSQRSLRVRNLLHTHVCGYKHTESRSLPLDTLYLTLNSVLGVLFQLLLPRFEPLTLQSVQHQILCHLSFSLSLEPFKDLLRDSRKNRLPPTFTIPIHSQDHVCDLLRILLKDR